MNSENKIEFIKNFIKGAVWCTIIWCILGVLYLSVAVADETITHQVNYLTQPKINDTNLTVLIDQAISNNVPTNFQTNVTFQADTTFKSNTTFDIEPMIGTNFLIQYIEQNSNFYNYLTNLIGQST